MEHVYTDKQLRPVLSNTMKKQLLPLNPSQIIQIWQMETYTDFRVSYLIQTFVNKVNAKLWHDCWVYLAEDFYYKLDQNQAILATLDSLSFSLSLLDFG